MAPNIGDSSSSENDSGGACSGCSKTINLQSPYGSAYAPIVAGDALQALALLGFLILWIWSFEVKKVFPIGE